MGSLNLFLYHDWCVFEIVLFSDASIWCLNCYPFPFDASERLRSLGHFRDISAFNFLNTFISDLDEQTMILRLCY